MSVWVYPYLVIPMKMGIQDKRSPYVPLDLRVKPEDDNIKNVPKMTQEKQRLIGQ